MSYNSFNPFNNLILLINNQVELDLYISISLMYQSNIFITQLTYLLKNKFKISKI